MIEMLRLTYDKKMLNKTKQNKTELKQNSTKTKDPPRITNKQKKNGSEISSEFYFILS